MRRLIIVALAAALLLTSCVSNKALYIAPEEKSSQSSPSSIGAKSQDGLQIVAGSDYFDGKNANFMLSLASLDQRTFTFNDTDIAIYGGNSDKDRWTLIENWNSSDYIVHEKNRILFRETMQYTKLYPPVFLSDKSGKITAKLRFN